MDGRVAGGMGGGSTGIIFGPIWAMISWRISMTPSFHWVMCVCMLSAMTTTPGKSPVKMKKGGHYSLFQPEK